MVWDLGKAHKKHGRSRLAGDGLVMDTEGDVTRNGMASALSVLKARPIQLPTPRISPE